MERLNEIQRRLQTLSLPWDKCWGLNFAAVWWALLYFFLSFRDTHAVSVKLFLPLILLSDSIPLKCYGILLLGFLRIVIPGEIGAHIYSL